MADHALGEMMSITMDKIKNMVDVNTIVGTPIQTPEGITLIPISKVSFGFASGGSDFGAKQGDAQIMFGGGSGAGASIVPIAFLIVNGENVKLLPVAPPPNNTVDRVVEIVPSVIDKISEYLKKDKKENQE